MIKVIQGFDVSSPLPIDGRLLLSRAEMETCCTPGTEEFNKMPDRYFTICEEDNLLYLYIKEYDSEGTLVSASFSKAVPEKLSQLENDGNGDLNSEGAVDPFDTVSSVEAKIKALDSKIDSNFVDNSELETTLADYSTIANTGSNIELEYRESEYKFRIKLYNANGTALVITDWIDLPVEQLVERVEYVEDSEGKALIITLENDETTRVPVDSLIYGLINQTTFDAHVNDSNIHTSATEKSTWNGKYSKPATGIPSSDLSSAVQASLGKADTAIQSSDLSSYATKSDVKDAISNSVIAGENVTITESSEGVIINATDTTYEAGEGISISSGNVISTQASAPTWTTIQSTSESGPMDNEDLAALFNAKQDKIGDGSTINSDDISDDDPNAHKFVTASDKST